MKKDAADLLRDRVHAAIPEKFKNITEIADKADINQGNFSAFMNGKRKGVNLETAWKLFSVLGPGGDRATATIHRLGEHSPKVVADKGGKLIDVYQVAGAGQAWEVVEIEPLKSINVPLSFAAQASFALLVQGDSMFPTLKSGCVVGVRRGEPFVSGEIYAVCPPEEGMSVKRIIYDSENERYILRSDNRPLYEDRSVPKSLAKNLIVGRVVWVWQGV